MYFSRLYLFLFVFIFIAGPLQSAPNFGDRIKNWLPDFISEWWWPEANQSLSQAEDITTIPGADIWLQEPDERLQDQDFHWPTTVLNPVESLTKWQDAQLQIVAHQKNTTILPLVAGSQLRLISTSSEFPIFVQQYLQTFCFVQPIQYDPTQDRSLVGLANDQATNLLYAAEAEGSNSLPDWVFDFSEVPLVLIWRGHEKALDQLPAAWTALHLPKVDLANEMTLASKLFVSDEGRTQCLTYAPPLVAGLDEKTLERVDYHLNRAIRRRATPGAQLLVAKNGQIVYHKSYGHHTYRRRQNVYTSDLYDLASITKAAATSLAIMHLYEKGKIELDKKSGDYLPELKHKAAGRHTIEQLLAHQTGLQRSLPALQFVGKGFVQDTASTDFPIPLSPDAWLDAEVPEKIIGALKKVNYTRRRIYRYSDVNYFILQQIIERIDERDLATLLDEEIYGPLGLNRLSFKPHEHFLAEQCVPTAKDNWMRGGIVRGYVHDEGAALMGGIAGHAGLFATATDLAQLFQMLLNKGTYNGQQVFEPETVELFTQKSRYNYRSLGFDRLQGGWPNVVKAGASEATFGHTGFSGTCVWADPDNELIFVLLTNRIHPDPKNRRFNRMNTRGKVHKQVYKSLLPSEA